ncbi:hypothetical protein AAE478_009418 [Parahypoxylon ruwenzoriense]
MKSIVALGLMLPITGVFASSAVYWAYSGPNDEQGTQGCTGEVVGHVTQDGAGASQCTAVDGGACVTLVGHTGNALDCHVLMYSDSACSNQVDRANFQSEGAWENHPFSSFLAQC